MKCTRRAHLAQLSALALLSRAGESRALGRPRYGDTLRLSLPSATNRLDPHDPEQLSLALYGSSLFEPLFGVTSEGQAYPTLAESLPRVEKSRLFVTLRPELLTSRGKKLDSESVVASLLRARAQMPFLSGLGVPRAEGAHALSFALGDPAELARTLALPHTALTPLGFLPESPDTTGALRVSRRGSTLILNRNPYAARGGSYLSEVHITQASLSDCLRAFEAGISELGWLGRGLHHPVREARDFRLPELGWVSLLAGRGLGRLRAPGVLQAVLNSTTSRALDSLGYARAKITDPKPHALPALRIHYPADCHQLRATAEALAEAWSRPGVGMQVSGEPRESLLDRRRSLDFDVLLGFSRTARLDARTLHLLLLHLDGATLPRQFHPEPPERLARRLHLGLVGALAPPVAVLPQILHLIGTSELQLAEAEKLAPQR